MNKKLYPSDLTREQFDKVLPMLYSVRKKTKPRTLDLHKVFNAVLYLLKTGCQWRALPKDYPDYRMVHYHFTIWRDSGILDKVLKKNNWRGPYKQWTERQD
jgi:transposase